MIILSLSQGEFEASSTCIREYKHSLDGYETIIRDKIRREPTLSAVKTATNWAYKKSAQTTDLGINTMYDLGGVSGWSYTTTNSLLWAKFSVASDKQVRFTKGNLYWDSNAFHIESSQTDHPTSWNANYVGHFFWSRTATVAFAYNYDDEDRETDDKFFCGSANSMTVDGQSGLYALSGAEWTYLINSRTGGLYKLGVTVTNGGTSYTNCLIIAPDNYSGTALSEITDWSLSNVNTLGLVCLPAAGYRYDTFLYKDGSWGIYWSATPNGGDEDYAYRLFFDGSGVTPSSDDYRENGNSVRLVSTVSK